MWRASTLKICLVVAVGCWLQVSHICNSAKIIDKNNIAEYQSKGKSPETLADALCRESWGQLIGRPSTILELSNWPKRWLVTTRNPKKDCMVKYKDQLNDLAKIVRDSRNDPCNPSLIESMNTFYIRHISNSDESHVLRLQQNLAVAPPMLAAFFVHFGMEIGSICRRFLDENLLADARKLSQENSIYLPTGVDSALDEELKKLGMLPLVGRKPNSPLMILNLPSLEDKFILEGPQIGSITRVFNMVEPLTINDHYSLFMKMKSVEGVHKIQQLCKRQLSPVYERLILPVETLANMGFHGPSSTTSTNAEDEKILQHWFKMTQICEAVRYIAFISDSTMNEDQVKLITRSEARTSPDFRRQLGLLSGSNLRYKPSKNVAAVPAYLRSIEKNAKDLVKLVNDNAKRREVEFRKMLIELYEFIQGRTHEEKLSNAVAKHATNNQLVVLRFSKSTPEGIKFKKDDGVVKQLNKLPSVIYRKFVGTSAPKSDLEVWKAFYYVNTMFSVVFSHICLSLAKLFNVHSHREG